MKRIRQKSKMQALLFGLHYGRMSSFPCSLREYPYFCSGHFYPFMLRVNLTVKGKLQDVRLLNKRGAPEGLILCASRTGKAPESPFF